MELVWLCIVGVICGFGLVLLLHDMTSDFFEFFFFAVSVPLLTGVVLWTYSLERWAAFLAGLATPGAGFGILFGLILLSQKWTGRHSGVGS